MLNLPPDGDMSVAAYVPRTELDFGSLLCWGFNDLGRQTTPCVFTILPAGGTRQIKVDKMCKTKKIIFVPGKPDAVTNCSVDNRTITAVIISCQVFT